MVQQWLSASLRRLAVVMPQIINLAIAVVDFGSDVCHGKAALTVLLCPSVFFYLLISRLCAD